MKHTRYSTAILRGGNVGRGDKRHSKTMIEKLFHVPTIKTRHSDIQIENALIFEKEI
jgi:hypothetical protein